MSKKHIIIEYRPEMFNKINDIGDIDLKALKQAFQKSKSSKSKKSIWRSSSLRLKLSKLISFIIS